MNVLIDLRISTLTSKQIQITNPHTKRLTHLHINTFFYICHVKKLQESPIIEKKIVSLQFEIKYEHQQS